MNLQEFISEALCHVVGAIKDAQDRTKETGGAVNPTGVYRKTDQLEGRGYHSGLVTELVEFDIAVTVKEAKAGKQGAGISISAFSLGGEKRTEVQNASISRIRFAVPVFFPPGKDFRGTEKDPPPDPVKRRNSIADEESLHPK